MKGGCKFDPDRIYGAHSGKMSPKVRVSRAKFVSATDRKFKKQSKNLSEKHAY
ncbi:hypothetical protein [Campylobacter showae]|uniref:hypothetical protein n=1 Tax=Campylobacter showae TaxID=204 RepID=UPI0013D38397|nr:hypothetical protein [Campylobacter showae]